MASEWAPHVVQQGEHVEKLAFLRGATPDEVWNDPHNASLKAKRASMHTLLPGDVIYLPDAPTTWLSLSSGTKNAYTAKVPKTEVRLVVHDDDGPIAGARYVVTGLPLAEGQAPLEGVTSASGEIKLSVPVTLREVTVRIPLKHLEYQVKIGDLDPHDEPSGARQRLKNLGFLAQAAGADADITWSVAAFQAFAGIPLTGQLDAATLAALADHASGSGK